jgi:CRISPR-associated protein Cas1
MKTSYYIFDNGQLIRQDDSLVFINGNTKQYIPIKQIDEINLFGNVDITKPAILLILSELKIINLFNYFGDYKGIICSNSNIVGVDLIKNVDFIKNQDKVNFLGKEILKSSISNMKNVLDTYKRSGRIFNDSYNKILKVKIKENASINKILMIEAAVKKNYYNCFNSITNSDDFIFTIRTIMPPKDNINALMSFGYTLLYSKVKSIFHQSRISPALAIIHGLTKDSDSFAYDVADIFKPIIIDRLIFRLINSKSLTKENFEPLNNGVYLNDSGRRIFILGFEGVLKTVIKYKSRKLSFLKIIEQEVLNISNTILENKPYVGFKYTSK